MTDLEKALETFVEHEGVDGKFLLDYEQKVFDAARRFANLTSPETIEKAAQAIDYAFDDTEKATELCRQLAEAVLRAVEE